MLSKKNVLFALLLCFAAVSGNAVSAQSRAWQPSFRNGVGKQEPMCRALLQYIRDYLLDPPDDRCSLGSIIASYPKFTEPNWEILDPKDHMDLLYILISSDFSENPHASDQEKREHRDYIQAKVNEFLKENGGMLILHVSPPLIYKSRGNAQAGKRQTFVQKGIGPSHEYSRCIGKPMFSWSGGIHIVKSDLSGRDMELDLTEGRTLKAIANDSAFLLNTHDLYMYDGKPILVGEQDIWRFSGGRSIHSVLLSKFY